MRTLRAICFAICLGAPGLAIAQGAEAGETPSDRATSFRAVTGPEQESVPGGALLVGGYGLVFALTLLYVVRLSALSRGTDARIARLEKLLAEADEKAR
jgi:hypothetical protein